MRYPKNKNYKRKSQGGLDYDVTGTKFLKTVSQVFEMTFMFLFKSHYRLVQNVWLHTPKFVTTIRKENGWELKIEQRQRISEKFIAQAKG